MLKKLYQRVVFCSRNKHEDAGFTSYPLPGGNLRVLRCIHCRQLIDVIFLGDESPVSVGLRLERILETIPGYPAA